MHKQVEVVLDRRIKILNMSYCTKTYYFVTEHLTNETTECHFIIYASCLVKLVMYVSMDVHGIDQVRSN